MDSTLPNARVSKLYQEYALKKKGKKMKEECCLKYQKKKGKYCKSCPIVHANYNEARRSF